MHKEFALIDLSLDPPYDLEGTIYRAGNVELDGAQYPNLVDALIESGVEQYAEMELHWEDGAVWDNDQLLDYVASHRYNQSLGDAVCFREHAIAKNAMTQNTVLCDCELSKRPMMALVRCKKLMESAPGPQ